VVQRLLSQPVTGKQQTPVPLIEQGEGKHTSELVNTIRSKVLVEMDDDFRVGIGPETVAPGFQLFSKFAKVVDLPVEHHPYGSILIEDRLLSAGQVNNSQAAHAQSRTRLDE